jgi:large subunit ribosomal protein L10
MPITKAKKQEMLSKLATVAKNPSVVFVNFHGLPMPETVELRSALRQNGVGFLVAKKTLVRKAFSEAGIAGELPATEGELALAYSQDALAAAREVYAFQKKFDGKLAIQGGTFESTFQNKVQMMEIAQIPDRQTLLGMFVNVINSPIQGLAVALNAVAEKRQSA